MDKQLASALLSAKASQERSERQLPPISKAAPWLVFPHGKGREFQSVYNPCEPNNRSCIKSIPEMQGRAYYHKTCHQGWLIVIGNVEDNAEYSVGDATNLDDCFLWNPVSSETIRLPSVDRRSFSDESEQLYMYDLVLSSPPVPSTCNPDNDDGCTVFLIFRGISDDEVSYDKHILVFCRPGDEHWRTKELDFCNNPRGDFSQFIESLLCFQGKLYAFCGTENWVNEIDIQKLWHHVVVDNETQFLKKFKVATDFPIDKADFPIIGGGAEFSNYMEDWVESGNEIFKVLLNCSFRGFERVASTHIFKLDFSSMTWVLVKSLGDHVLFLCTTTDMDFNSRKCYSTSSAYSSAADMGLERGCLFYTLPEDQTLYTYEVEDNATTTIMPCARLQTPRCLPTWIMMPTTVTSQVAGRRRRISDFLVSEDTAETSTEEENIGMVNSSGEELEALLKQWDFLNDRDSTEEIGKFLHPVDYIHFRVACKQNSIFLRASNRKLASTRTTTTTYLSPWLISIFEDNEEAICNIVDPMHNNDKYLMKLSDNLLVGATIRFSKDGWLLLSNGKKTVFCYNPFTRAIICLPDLPDNYTLGGMSFSSVPTSRDCVVIAISNWWELGGENEICFLVTELGMSATGWTIHEFYYRGSTKDNFMPCINNPVFYRGAFYCLDYNGMLGVFNVKGDPSWKLLSKSLRQFSGIYPSFLVEYDEKLVLVNLGQSGKSIEIYRLDESKMVWVELKSLGKHALFISYTSSFSAVAPRSCMENKIYFPRLYGERILYYSLDTCRYHCAGSDQHSSKDFHNTKERSNCTWIQPNWSQATHNQETGDSMLKR